MVIRLNRRHLLAGGILTLAGAARAEAPAVSLRPVPRPGSTLPPDTATILARAGLSGEVAIALADADSGNLLELIGSDLALPPASVTKVFTGLYARDLLGPDFRFATRLMATGPVVDGVLDGDLILAGGGDPVLVTDDLATLAERLHAAGLREVRGSFHVWGGALPHAHEIDPAQLPYLGYNPSVSGLNLNFNRVHFEWAPQGGDYRVSMDARSATHRPEVSIARIRVERRDGPVFTYEDDGGADSWTVARSALGDGGSRWLPVRKPALYAGDVFRTLALAQGIRLPGAEEITDLPVSEELARFESAPLETIITEMLDYSTNITAEVLGLTASRLGLRRPLTLAESAAMMAEWTRDRLGVRADFVDHSGLGAGSAIGAGEMAVALTAAAQDGALIRLLKEIRLVNEAGDPMTNPPARVRAKTGTLDFVSALAGYILVPGGRRMVFAIFTADPDRRATAKASGAEVPAGSRDWARRARRLQQDLLYSWAVRQG